jgi:outer membrane protein
MGDLQEKGADMLPAIREAKVQELADAETRIQKFETNAQNELMKLEEQLSVPILEKAQATISEVADSKGYTYVFDNSTGVLLHYPDGDDITPLVKAKLGIN